jgi:DNA repair protein RadC
MRELAEDERPRERLLKHGPEVASDTELVAILLGSGTHGENVVDLARALLEQLGGLEGLVRADTAALQRLRGLGPAKAAQLAAAIEIGRRMPGLASDARPLLTTPEAVFAFIGGRMAGKPKEELQVLPLDMKGRLIGAPLTVRGGTSMIQVDPAGVFREAMILSARSVILVHNHPSGDPKPSPQDVATTKELAAAGKLLEITVHDHVIIGQGRFVSLAREGMLRG